MWTGAGRYGRGASELIRSVAAPACGALALVAMLVVAVLWSSNAVRSAPAQQIPTDPSTIELELDPIDIELDRAVAVVAAGDGSGRLFVIEKAGRVRIVQHGELVATPFLDIEDRVRVGHNEQGLLGIVFDPDFPTRPYFYLNYNADGGGDAGRTVISRFAVSAEDPNLADRDSEVEILTLDQPFGNHNGGHLTFGPDGYLYIGTGDGGRAGDPLNSGQSGDTLLGKMLRIDVSGEDGYTVPEDNPFVDDDEVLDEVWALGLRNPWRYSFDPGTGDLYIADVGQNQWEEVNHQPATSTGGENYGWRIMEGAHCYRPPTDCDREGLVLPVAEYDHSRGDRSITGGLVYRGSRYPGLDGIYFYADYISGRFWGLARSPLGQWQNAEVGDFQIRPSSFGYGEDGEIYVTNDGGGPALYRLAQAGTDPVEITPSPSPTVGPPVTPPLPTQTPDPTDAPPSATPTGEPTATGSPAPVTYTLVLPVLLDRAEALGDGSVSAGAER